jgi:hypothetical protein
VLSEDTVYLRLSTFHDLVDDATFLEILQLLDEWNRHPFDTYTDLAMRGRARPVTPELLLDELHDRVGAGLHQIVRFRLDVGQGPVASYEFMAGAHPYTGVFHTSLDIRVRGPWVRRNPEMGPRLLKRRFLELVHLTHPFQGHVHDTDDNSIQNVGDPGLLKRGFGVEVEGRVELASNPGRELSRGEYRYAVNWLTLFGPALLERVTLEAVQSVPVATVEQIPVDFGARSTPGQHVAERMGATFPERPTTWWLVQLGPTPTPFEPQREAQRGVRSHLRYAELAESERWPLGYWQKKR